MWSSGTLHVGFTGTQRGMSAFQLARLNVVLDVIVTAYERGNVVVHSGDCVGADEQFHELTKHTFGLRSVGHPPINTRKRAFCDFDEEWEPREYLQRDRDIVHVSHLLIAAPLTDHEVRRSGTWATIRVARRSVSWRPVLQLRRSP